MSRVTKVPGVCLVSTSARGLNCASTCAMHCLGRACRSLQFTPSTSPRCEALESLEIIYLIPAFVTIMRLTVPGYLRQFIAVAAFAAKVSKAQVAVRVRLGINSASRSDCSVEPLTLGWSSGSSVRFFWPQTNHCSVPARPSRLQGSKINE